MKILLANAPWIRDGIFGVRAGSRWPHFQEDNYLPFPFFLSYTASVLERDNHEVYLIDAIAEQITKDKFINRVKEIKPQLILFEISTPSLPDDLDIAHTIRDKFDKKIKIAFCGPHYELYNPDFLDKHDFIDFLLYGEYEYTIKDLAKTINYGGSFSKVKGIIYKGIDTKPVKTPPRPLIANLDELPWPSRDKLPIYKYSDQPGGIPKPTLQMWASRGCPYKCIFCAWPQLMYGNNSYRTRNPVEVVDEMEQCIKKYGFKSVYFDDDTFNIGNERMLELCSEIKKRNIKIPWAIMARADTLTKDVLKNMKEAGLYSLKFGVESGVQELINSSGKNLSLEKVKESMLWCKELDIKVHLTFMFGLPGETKDTINKTIDFALNLEPDSVQFSIATPFPGSVYYKQLESKNELLTKDWSKYDGAKHAVISTDSLSGYDLEKAVKYAYRKWDLHKLRKKYLTRKYFVKSLIHPVRAIKTISRILPW